MEIKSMAAEEGAGTSNVIKEQYEKYEKFVRVDIFYFPPLQKEK